VPTVLVHERLDATLVERAVALVGAVEAQSDRPALSDHLRLDLLAGDRPGVTAASLDHDGEHGPAGTLAAYAQASPANGGWVIGLVVDPAISHRCLEVGTRLLCALIDGLRSPTGGRPAAGDTITWWVSDPDGDRADVAAALGLRAGRHLYQMRVPLPLDVHATVTTRPFVPGVDDATWLDVNNRAFADHPEQGAWDPELLVLRCAESWFDPEGFLLHEREGRLAAFCWTKIHQETHPVMGEIYVIAVDPEFHGLGLGRELTLAGLDAISARGITVGMLHVDASNTPALTLYRSLGFVVHHTDVAFAGTIGEFAEARGAGVATI
jgi:mycothiol synthase